MTQTAPTDITFQEYLACTSISFSWAQSYDTKDWERLASIVTPELHIDYRSVMDSTHRWPSMPASDYVSMMSNPKTLGNPFVSTQHFLGTSTWERTAEGEITGTFQIRAHHIRFSTDKEGKKGTEILASATGHGVMKHFYKRVEGGIWKLAGLQPTVQFDQGDLHVLFGIP